VLPSRIEDFARDCLCDNRLAALALAGGSAPSAEEVMQLAAEARALYIMASLECEHLPDRIAAHEVSGGSWPSSTKRLARSGLMCRRMVSFCRLIATGSKACVKSQKIGSNCMRSPIPNAAIIGIGWRTLKALIALVMPQRSNAIFLQPNPQMWTWSRDTIVQICTVDSDLEHLRGSIASEKGLGREVILRFFAGVNGITPALVNEHLANLRASGAYGRLGTSKAMLAHRLPVFRELGGHRSPAELATSGWYNV